VVECRLPANGNARGEPGPEGRRGRDSVILARVAVPTLILNQGRDRSLRRRHPWVFSGGVDRVTGDPGRGDTVAVRDASGAALGWAAWSPDSQLSARLWSFDPDASIDAGWFVDAVATAAAKRAPLAARTDAVRLVFGESDGLPGVIADRYGSVVVLQLSSAGADRWRDELTAAFAALEGVRTVYERSDLEVRDKEGLLPRAGLLFGDEPLESLTIVEDGARYLVDVRAGHKTGFYLDQRDNRALVRSLADGRRVLNVFGYTGSFTVSALLGGAVETTTIDSSRPALALAGDNLTANGLPPGDLVRADAFADLRVRRDAGVTYDLIVLDPPKLANHKGQLDRAARAYKDLNWLALRLLAPGGALVTFSCSGAVDDAFFRKILAGAAADAHRDVVVERWLTQASDHPIPLAFPEAAYLNGAVLRA
jgi:23S rRNA (cytosine1962-C5)-methyltransferase